MIAFGVETLKATALISGGSAAALLAFMGALVAHDQGGLAAWFPGRQPFRGRTGVDVPWHRQRLSGADVLHAQPGRAPEDFLSYVVDTAGHDRWRRAGLAFQGLTIVLVLASYVALVVGYTRHLPRHHAGRFHSLARRGRRVADLKQPAFQYASSHGR